MANHFSLFNYDEAADYLRARTHHRPTIGLILGSGLSGLAARIEDATAIPYADIPHFPVSTVAGHAGRLVIGTLAGATVCAMQGRFHYYEGYSMQQVTLPVRVMQRLGIGTLIVTNAAGGLNPSFAVGDIMLIEDHINLQPDNPLRGENFEVLGPRFPDMSRPYDKSMNKKLTSIAKKLDIKLNEGVYVGVMGPNLETRAEYRFLRMIGADAVGMSTIPEVLVANHMGLPCCAISALTDDCDPDDLEPTNLSEIVKVAAKAESKLTDLLIGLIKAL